MHTLNGGMRASVPRESGAEYSAAPFRRETTVVARPANEAPGRAGGVGR